MDSRDVSDLDQAGVSLGWLLTGRLVQAEHGEGSNGATAAIARTRACAAALRLFAAPRVAASRRLVRQSPTRQAVVPPRRVTAPASVPPTKAHGVASGRRARPDGASAALEHGLGTRSAVRWSALSHSDPRRSLESRECAAGVRVFARRPRRCAGPGTHNLAARSPDLDHVRS